MIEHWITSYGYFAVAVGTFLEGETIVVLAGFAAHRGYLGLPQVVAAAFAGTLAGDQLLFHLGRGRSEAVLRRRPSWRQPVERVRRLLERHQLLVVLGFRFLYGLRTATPFAIGLSGFPRARFLVLNAVGAAVWATAVGTLGYLFGHTLETLLGEVKRYEVVVLLVVAGGGGVIWAAHCLRGRRHRKPLDAAGGPARPG